MIYICRKFEKKQQHHAPDLITAGIKLFCQPRSVFEVYSIFEFEGLVNLICNFVTCCDPLTSIFSSASRNCKVSLKSVWMHDCRKLT